MSIQTITNHTKCSPFPSSSPSLFFLFPLIFLSSQTSAYALSSTISLIKVSQSTTDSPLFFLFFSSLPPLSFFFFSLSFSLFYWPLHKHGKKADRRGRKPSCHSRLPGRGIEPMFDNLTCTYSRSSPLPSPLLVANDDETGASPSRHIRSLLQRVRWSLRDVVVVRLDLPECGASRKWQQGGSLHGTDM
ncbi:hypothetical protein THAOC_13097 [Thalassiosira oceanica]|uniref:Uncharacterized protein n=1 Tax=Thalassiosira oceanica TaxID=159749 RepID=K0SYB9_THAOC|nr:hypothetical protein THAOC_13097 [Thalassiosira oceanica]|eukprot:EJK66006.1 hypothetical protein THAOC_13097 [Thalassiosira oceanica]